MPPLKALAVSLLVIGLAGCELNDDENGDTTTEIPFAIVAQGSLSGITSERFEVDRDSSDFTALWSQHVDGLVSPSAQPSVDFEQDMVVAAFMGSRSGASYGITVTRVEESDDHLLVSLTTTSPGAGCVVATAVSQPYQLVTVSRSDKIVLFDTTAETVDCE